ncbi:hypothetical protein [Epilithonimonas hominis]|uniref:Uncharacterized protein n=1 Tax=Epilithonimonas hominis TaxID=420404 RepID=A0A3N0XBH6_9FLAO|nr:hypothetical protein [Epilithonimonas hominis]ROI14515.1 hypothetical protein EGH73_02790 [Epilithonimonas hominis]
MKKTLEKFKASHLEKAELFNTMSKKIFGGDTSSNGQSTASTGADGDNATSDQDQDPNGPTAPVETLEPIG